MIEITRVHHLGIRVADLERSLAFYAKLGFDFVWRDPEDTVAVLKNAAGVELNLIFNANDANAGRNVLIDEARKYPGHTHVALEVPSMEETTAALAAAGIKIADGPMPLGEGISLFIRDPDRTVIELRQGKA